jgi:hydroxymethylpyrimidine pyrophosphatase-like HAD family hydrolase
MKSLIVFDLDGTLAESKSSIDGEMASLLDSLLTLVKLSVISGGAWPQFEQQVVVQLRRDDWLRNLSLLPTCGTKFYRYGERWELLYSEDFTVAEKKTIIDSLQQAIASADCKVDKVWGEVIEDRGSQITFSALCHRFRKPRLAIVSMPPKRASRVGC